MKNTAPITATLLFLAGLTQMAGEIANLPALSGLGIASAVAPAPRVFSSVRGLETFSSVFVVEWTDELGRRRFEAIDRARYARLRGPYARRNVYGAALAYGPVLASGERTRALLEGVLARSLCGEAPLARELGIPAGRDARIRVVPRRGTTPSHLPLVFQGGCR